MEYVISFSFAIFSFWLQLLGLRYLGLTWLQSVIVLTVTQFFWQWFIRCVKKYCT